MGTAIFFHMGEFNITSSRKRVICFFLKTRDKKLRILKRNGSLELYILRQISHNKQNFHPIFTE